jgi:hypothetical protein
VTSDLLVTQDALPNPELIKGPVEAWVAVPLGTTEPIAVIGEPAGWIERAVADATKEPLR